MELIDEFERNLIGALGSISAYKLVRSKESSKTVRDMSKKLDSLSVNLRKHLIEEDKQLKINL